MPRFRILILLVTAQITHADPIDVSQRLDEIRQKYRLPALTAACMREGAVTAQGVAGFRHVGSSDPATLADLWHIGSCTKSMTATLAAVLVDEGKIRWDSTVGDAFPEFRSAMKAPWPTVTLQQLLNHRSGAPTNAPTAAWLAASKEIGTPLQQRLDFIRAVLKEPLEAPPGTKFIYSNQGFTIAGAMLERAAKKPYEDLIREKVFVPLGMKSAGFGAPGQGQPYGHNAVKDTYTPLPPGPGADNPAAITPAGRVHCTILDFARYASWHARGPLVDTKLMSDASFQPLHLPAAGQEYAMGWFVLQRDWAKGNALMHNGSNLHWYALMWIAPATQSAYVAITNAPGDDAAKACDDAVSMMIGL